MLVCWFYHNIYIYYHIVLFLSMTLCWLLYHALWHERSRLMSPCSPKRPTHICFVLQSLVRTQRSKLFIETFPAYVICTLLGCSRSVSIFRWINGLLFYLLSCILHSLSIWWLSKWSSMSNLVCLFDPTEMVFKFIMIILYLRYFKMLVWFWKVDVSWSLNLFNFSF